MDIVSKIVNKINYILNYKKNSKETIKNLKAEISDLQERLRWFIDHSEITALKPASGSLRKKQMDLIEFAGDFFSEISSLDIHPFLIGGNLIGAYRHKGFVPWDDDLDFGLIRSEYESLIDYCRDNCIVKVFDGKKSEYTYDVAFERIDSLVKEYPNTYILNIWIDQLQLIKGTSCIDAMSIDFWSFDYYKEDYKIEDHIEYLRELTEKKKQIDYIDKTVDFLKDERINNQNISIAPTGIIFPGIDSVEGYIRVDRTEEWLRTDYLFPLKKAEYENTWYYIPNNTEKWLSYEYPDYMSFPPDAGKMPHDIYRESYIIRNYPVVGFYIKDISDITFFTELYKYVEGNSIYPKLLIVPPENGEDQNDYENVIKTINNIGYRYCLIQNSDIDFLITNIDSCGVKEYSDRTIRILIKESREDMVLENERNTEDCPTYYIKNSESFIQIQESIKNYIFMYCRKGEK